MEKAEELKKAKNLYKVFLIVFKYILHIEASVYMIYTLLSFYGVDYIIVGCFFHLSLFPWICFLLMSIVFRFCYVHRLPLYYIGANELITSLDYYVGIPLEEFNLIVLHSLLAISLIFGYSLYYIRKLNKK